MQRVAQSMRLSIPQYCTDQFQDLTSSQDEDGSPGGPHCSVSRYSRYLLSRPFHDHAFQKQRRRMQKYCLALAGSVDSLTLDVGTVPQLLL